MDRQRGSRPLKVGLFLNIAERMMDGKTARWRDIVAMARLAEEIGFDSIWLPDHLLFRMEPGEPEGFWECTSILAALAATTRHVELGAAVHPVSFRNPAMLAKIADTIDEISDGRFVLGLGAGYHDPEYRAFGYPTDRRYSRFEEAFTIIHGLLRNGAVDFEGHYHQARECELRPRGPRPNGPPIMIGTTGEKMLRLTARYADSWNAWLPTRGNHPDALAPMQEAVDAACREVGRDPAALGRSAGALVSALGRTEAHVSRLGAPLTGSPDEIADLLRRFAGEGLSELQVWAYPSSPAGIEAFGPVLERLDRDQGRE